MRGRKPKPTHLKVLAGNPGKRPLNKAEPKPQSGLPECPDFLAADAKLEWNALGPELTRIDLMSRADRAAFSIYCQAWADWKKATEVLSKTPPVFMDPKAPNDPSKFIWNPWWGVMKTAEKRLLKAIVEFGLSPSSRSRVSKAEDDQEEDDFDALVRARK